MPVSFYYWGKPEQVPHTRYSCARNLYYTLLWYIGHAKLYIQQCSMDINAKHSIVHSHACGHRPYIHSSNLANCKFTLMLLVLCKKIRSQTPPSIVIMAHGMNVELSVNKRKVRLQRRTELIGNHSQLNSARSGYGCDWEYDRLAAHHETQYSTDKRAKAAMPLLPDYVAISYWHTWHRIDITWRELSGRYMATTTIMVCLDLYGLHGLCHGFSGLSYKPFSAQVRSQQAMHVSSYYSFQ